MTTVIQKCDAIDVQHIAKLYDTEDAMFADRKTTQHWIKAVNSGRVVGCVSFFKVGKEKVRLSNLFVVPSARGAGIGNLLVNGVELSAKRMGYKKVQAVTRRSIFKAMGYQTHRSFKDYLLMEKNLENLPKANRL